MKFPEFWKKKKVENTSRRIYKGDVPHLRGEPYALQPGVSRRDRRSIRSTTSQNQSYTNPAFTRDEDEALPRPRSIRRESIAQSRPGKFDNQPEKFPSNLVITSRYKIWNFIPKNLYEQFRRVVNVYFLIIAINQLSIDTPVHPVSAVAPLTFVICVTAIKQGYEDWLRHKTDDQVNNRKVKVVRDGELKEIKARQIRVGDVVKLESDDQVPADVLLLGSSDEFLRCQINTANLDGETNLKLRYCPSGLPHFGTINDISNFHCIVECEQPCEDLYEFNGSLMVPINKLKQMQSRLSINSINSIKSADRNYFNELMSSGGVVREGATDFLSIPLSMDNLVLRGTRVKNTDFIYGLAVYTGKDTRLAKNSERVFTKFSSIEKAINYYLLFYVCILIFLISLCTTLSYTVNWWPGSGDDGPWYTDEDSFGVGNTIASFLILFNYIIPISLYVTIELQKFFGSLFFVWDQDMVDDEGRPPLCNTSDLNEELGQIEYLFSDKTGTLTKNLMQFRQCSVNGVRYKLEDNDEQLTMLDANGNASGERSNPLESEKVVDFLKTLALCHSVQVVPKRRPSFVKKGKKEAAEIEESLQRQSFYEKEQMEVQASSPDEKALLEFCEKFGIIYRGEKADVLSIEVKGKLENYKRLVHLEFDADRKCMSVIVENDAGEKWLLTKGAESSIIPNCDEGPSKETLSHVMDYALMGLRTLAISVRKLSTEEYEEFTSELGTARRLIKNRQESVRAVYSKIESHMTLLGATGVEDQLQDFVPETLQSFAAAGIRVWMLTGDKLETGMNVAISCGLITASTKQHIVAGISEGEEVKKKLLDLKENVDWADDNTCFAIDGDTLALAFKECSELLREVSMKAFRVVCCRMAPLQKAQIVQMVQSSKGSPTTCAVGDGANDCAMILAAHLGIGILGKEGRQAARAADFAVAKFGHLRKAILVHGHWYYTRLAILCNYFFYKNVVFVLPQFYFSFYSNFSTTAIFNGLFLMVYNLIFASVPIVIFGLFDQPHSPEVLLKNPHLYQRNKRNAVMAFKKFLPWGLSSLWHSLVIYFLPYFAWKHFGDMDNVMSFGGIVFTGLMVTTCVKMALETTYITWYYFASQVFSFVSYFVVTAIYAEVDFLEAGEFRGAYFRMHASTCFWVLMIGVTVIAHLPDFIFLMMRNKWKLLFRKLKVN